MTVRKNISLNYLNLDDAAEWPERTEEYHKMPERVRIAVFGLAIRSTPMVLAQSLAISEAPKLQYSERDWRAVQCAHGNRE